MARFQKKHQLGYYSKFSVSKNIFEFDKKLYISHRYNLLLKDYVYYYEKFKNFDINPAILNELKKRNGGYWWQTNPKGKKAFLDKAWWEEVLKC